MNVKEPAVEVLKFDGNDEECTHLIHKNDTKIISSQESHNKGSSKLTLRNFVDFSWDHYYYRRQLIALNLTEQYVAYGFTKPGTPEGCVRVVKRETNERALIKGFSFMVEDLRFAYLHEIIILACVDQSGSVYVYAVNEDPSKKLVVHKIFQIKEDPSRRFEDKHLLSWCQFIPEQINCSKDLEFNSTYNGKILAVARGSEVEIWHIGLAINFTSGPVYANSDLNAFDQIVTNGIKNALIKIDLKDFVVVDVSFSPNGSTVSIAMNNGSIYFYEISFENDQTGFPQRIFTWEPQELKMCLKSMAYLDNRKHLDGDIEFWKYVVTLTDSSELILWSCETWTPLQKLTFVRRTLANNPMKLLVDETGKFIFLSDIDNNLLYVMEISLDINSPNNHVKIFSISEILLQSPMLNMIIVDVKINHNDVNSLERRSFNNIMSNGFSWYNTIINLFAIQPKSIQEGQLIVLSPGSSTMEQFNSKTNTFPKPPCLDILMDNVKIVDDDKKEELNTPKGDVLVDQLLELSSMDLHNMVKERLKTKGINIIDTNVSTSPIHETQLPSKLKNNFNNMIQPIVQPLQDNTYSPSTFVLPEVRECSPSNNEVQKILHAQELEFDFKTIPMEGHGALIDDNYVYANNYSMDAKELNYSGSMFNSFNSSSINSVNKNEKLNNGLRSQADDIYACLQDMNNQLKCISKKQKTSNDQLLLKIQKMIDLQLGTHLNNIATIVKNSNKVDTDLFTKTLVSSLSPTLDTILKDLFMSTVIPKFEQACCSMFKQIDSSFTERSLEYQNELKLLLNEEGNINSKLEHAFDKFRSDMNSIIKHTENNILRSQNDMQKQFSSLIKEKSLSTVESYLKDSESYANQLTVLGNILDRGDYTTAFEKALCASNLDLVLFVCEKVSSEDIFQPPYELKTPIVLSLIQQLSHDLCTNTEIKYRYLDAAVGSLDYQNDLHKENMNFVLQKLEKNVEKLLQQFPHHAYARKFKMLQFAVKTILNQNKF